MSKTIPGNDDNGGRGSHWVGPPVALFWDQALPWGIICAETLQQLDIPFHLLTAEEIAAGRLDGYRILLVPGGWASHKIEALGKLGETRIKEFIRRGGSYLGFCGGAGMALSSRPSLNIVPLERMPLSDRLPSASGHVVVRGIEGHPAWTGLPLEFPVSIWWPSQFNWQPLPGCTPLGVYLSAGSDFRVADICVSDLDGYSVSWAQWEKVYGINLNPERLIGHPAILEAREGRGRLILSYPHLETPGDRLGNQLFRNILHYLDSMASKRVFVKDSPSAPKPLFDAPPGENSLDLIRKAKDAIDELISFGERHLLWTWRQPWLLQWRRGIRGLEYGSLAVAMSVLADECERMEPCGRELDPWREAAGKLEESVRSFCRPARRLLLEENLALQAGALTKLGKVNDTVDQLREELFGNRMSHAGICQTLFDELDALLLQIFRLKGRRDRETK